MELTSRRRSDEIPKAIEQLQLSYGEPGCVDICLASNIIEVGVDIDRLGLMTIVGQPKTTAQYIQVSGRVGRRARRQPRPGHDDLRRGQAARPQPLRALPHLPPASLRPGRADLGDAVRRPGPARAHARGAIAHIRQVGPRSEPYPFPERGVRTSRSTCCATALRWPTPRRLPALEPIQRQARQAVGQLGTHAVERQRHRRRSEAGPDALRRHAA